MVGLVTVVTLAAMVYIPPLLQSTNATKNVSTSLTRQKQLALQAQQQRPASNTKVLGDSNVHSPQQMSHALVSKQQAEVTADLDRHILNDTQAKLIQTELTDLQKFLDSLTGKGPDEQNHLLSDKQQEVRQWAASNNVEYHYVDVLDNL